MACRQVMFLVDFDNVSPEVIEQAFATCMADYGAIHVRRAYCTAEQAQHNAAFLKRLSLRPMVNLAVGKNSTDIALAVDAIDLMMAERPEVAVIVSSDSDYTPLVGRLREKGAWVRGFGQQGKTGDGVQMAYDEFSDIVHREARRAAAPPENLAKPAVKLVPKPVAKSAVKPVAKRTPVRKAPGVVVPVLSPEVEAILHAVPQLRQGKKIELSEAAHALRVAGLLGKTAASTRLFKKHVGHFLLTPEKQPNKVQFVRPAPGG
ncbi:MAG TPA: NYN domain-containing protein [Burkholderiaceae bacterium]